MKKIKIPFSLEEYNKGGYEVETRSGKQVRIGFTDAKCNHQPIMALVENIGEELSRFYYKDGRYSTNWTSSEDLFLIKYEFEDGDIVYSDNAFTQIISIFKKFRDNKLSTIDTYATVHDCREVEVVSLNDWCDACHIRLATEEEKRMLFNELAAQKGLKWNAEIKDFEKIEKEPDEKNVEIKKGDLFFCVKTFHSKGESDNRFSEFRIYESPEDGYIRDNNGINRGFACSESQFAKYFTLYDDKRFHLNVDPNRAKELVINGKPNVFVYYRGVKGRGSEIIAALEKFGD